MNLGWLLQDVSKSSSVAPQVQSYSIIHFYLTPPDSQACRWRTIKCHLNLFLNVLLEIYQNDILVQTSLRSVMNFHFTIANLHLTGTWDDLSLDQKDSQCFSYAKRFQPFTIYSFVWQFQCSCWFFMCGPEVNMCKLHTNRWDHISGEYLISGWMYSKWRHPQTLASHLGDCLPISDASELIFTCEGNALFSCSEALSPKPSSDLRYGWHSIKKLINNPENRRLVWALE